MYRNGGQAFSAKTKHWTLKSTLLFVPTIWAPVMEQALNHLIRMRTCHSSVSEILISLSCTRDRDAVILPIFVFLAIPANFSLCFSNWFPLPYLGSDSPSICIACRSSAFLNHPTSAFKSYMVLRILPRAFTRHCPLET